LPPQKLQHWEVVKTTNLERIAFSVPIASQAYAHTHSQGRMAPHAVRFRLPPKQDHANILVHSSVSVELFTKMSKKLYHQILNPFPIPVRVSSQNSYLTVTDYVDYLHGPGFG